MENFANVHINLMQFEFHNYNTCNVPHHSLRTSSIFMNSTANPSENCKRAKDGASLRFNHAADSSPVVMKSHKRSAALQEASTDKPGFNRVIRPGLLNRHSLYKIPDERVRMTL